VLTPAAVDEFVAAALERDLDLAYLRQAAAALAVSDLLDRALADSGGA